MSYAGTYGPSETCEHDNYGRNCPACEHKRFLKRAEREWPIRREHAREARAIVPTVERIEVVSGQCPNALCSWSRYRVSRDQWDEAIARHVIECERIEAEWQRELEASA